MNLASKFEGNTGPTSHLSYFQQNDDKWFVIEGILGIKSELQKKTDKIRCNILLNREKL